MHYINSFRTGNYYENLHKVFFHNTLLQVTVTFFHFFSNSEAFD